MSSETFNLKINLTLRDWQKKADKEFKRFTTIVAHRRSGKTILNIYKQLKYIFSLDLPDVRKRAAYIAPTYSQAKDITWAYYKEFLKDMPQSMVQFNESELKIKFIDGTVISLYGAENYDNMRGIYLNHCILDEYQMISPNALSKVILPTLDDYKGQLILTGTPNGKNDFYYRYLLGKNKEAKDWASMMFTIYDTNVYTEEEIKYKKEIEYKYKPEDYRQEMECSFEAAARGSIFGKEVSRLREEKRIVEKEYDPAYPVVAGLDIGFDGIGIWYVQKIGPQLVLIDMDFFKDEDIPYTANMLLGKRYVYDHIILPHDGVKRSILEKSKTAKGQLEQLGFKVKVAKRLPIMDAVAATRMFINKIQITNKCVKKRFKFEGGESTPLDALSLYQFKVDDEGHSREQEKHDDASHIGAALRTLAVGLKIKHSNKDFDIQTRSRYNLKIGRMKVNNKWNPLNRRNNK